MSVRVERRSRNGNAFNSSIARHTSMHDSGDRSLTTIHLHNRVRTTFSWHCPFFQLSTVAATLQAHVQVPQLTPPPPRSRRFALRPHVDGLEEGGDVAPARVFEEPPTTRMAVAPCRCIVPHVVDFEKQRLRGGLH